MNDETTEIRLVLPRYLPSSRNQLKGSHWSAPHHERSRAARALLAALESDSRSTPSDHATMTDTPSKSFKTCAATLASWMVTNGISLNVTESDLKRFTRRKKNARKS